MVPMMAGHAAMAVKRPKTMMASFFNKSHNRQPLEYTNEYLQMHCRKS